MEGEAKFSCWFHRFVSTARISRGNFSKTGKRRIRLYRDVECYKTRRNTKEATTWGQDEGVTEDVRLPVRPTRSPFNARAPKPRTLSYVSHIATNHQGTSMCEGSSTRRDAIFVRERNGVFRHAEPVSQRRGNTPSVSWGDLVGSPVWLSIPFGECRTTTSRIGSKRERALPNPGRLFRLA